MDDLISRQDAINLLEKWADGYNYIEVETESAIKKFQHLPSAQPVDIAPVMYGEWIKTTVAERCGTDELHRTVYRDRETVKCSECGNPSPIYNIEFEFCPRCGAKMDGEV